MGMVGGSYGGRAAQKIVDDTLDSGLGRNYAFIHHNSYGPALNQLCD